VNVKAASWPPSSFRGPAAARDADQASERSTLSVRDGLMRARRGLMIRTAARFAALALAGAISACSSLDVAGPTTVPAPSNLVVVPDPADVDLFHATWTMPATEVQGVALEVRAPDGAWGGLTVLPECRSGGCSVRVAEATPEATTLQFRVRTFADDVPSVPAEATAWRGVHPPINTTASIFAPFEEAQVFWYRRAQVDAVRIERRVVPPAGEPGPWADVTAATGVRPEHMGAVDRDVALFTDGARFAYRVTHVKNGHESAPAEATTLHAPPLAPEVTAAVDGDAVRVSWRNPGVSPVEWRVERADAWGIPIVLAELGAGTTEHLDPLPPSGLHEYRVQARHVGTPWEGGLSPYDTSPRGAAKVLAPDASWAGALDAELRWMPGGDAAARRADGAFAVAQGGLGGGVSAPDGSGWEFWPAPHTLVQAPLHFDPDGGLHLVYRTRNDANPTWLVKHALREDGGWTVEDVGTIAEYAPIAPSVAVDAAGRVHVLWRDRAFPVEPATWALRSGGTWTEELLPPPWADSSYANDPYSPIAVDPSGWPGFLIAGTVLRRGPEGWSADAVGGLSGTARDVVLLADGAALVASAVPSTSTPGATDCRVHERDATGWLDPVTVLAGCWSGDVALAVSADGTRVAVRSGNRVALRGGGTWRTFTLTSVWTQGTQVMGFTPAGKLWVLTLAPPRWDAPDALDASVLYEER
jgi:hypothetical protein